MHDESRAYVADAIDTHGPFVNVLDVGGRNVNGTYRDLPQLRHVDRYYAVDKSPGPGVDAVLDFAEPGTHLDVTGFDLAVCTNVFEHEPRWRNIPANVFAHLAPGGVFVVTVPGPAFPEHSDDGAALVDGVFYEPGRPDELRAVLSAAGFTMIDLWADDMDVGAVATKGTR